MAEKDSRQHEGPSVCGFCHLREDVEAVCGKLWQTASCCAHHKCMVSIRIIGRASLAGFFKMKFE